MFLFVIVRQDGISSDHIGDVIEALHSGVYHYLSSAHDPNETSTLNYTLNDGEGDYSSCLCMIPRVHNIDKGWWY